MSIQELDPAAADEVVAKAPPVDDDFFHRVLVEEPGAAAVPSRGRLARGARATGRGVLTLTLFVLGLAVGGGAGLAYGTGLVAGGDHVDLLPSYAAWPVLWWVLLGSVPVVLGLAFWKRIRPLCFGYLLALPWQLVFVLVYAYATYGTWGYGPTP